MKALEATRVTGARVTAERFDLQACKLKAAALVLRLINEGWILQTCDGGYTLRPPQPCIEVRQ